MVLFVGTNQAPFSVSINEWGPGSRLRGRGIERVSSQSKAECVKMVSMPAYNTRLTSLGVEFRSSRMFR